MEKRNSQLDGANKRLVLQALHITNKDRYQSTSARRAFALLNSPRYHFWRISSMFEAYCTGK